MRQWSGVRPRGVIRMHGVGERLDGEVAPAGRIAELDSVRGLAALAVLIYHANRAWLPFGWAGVDLFFVLSGYLITSIILKNGGSAGFLRNFYVRRGLRTWPIYYLLIGILIVLSPFLARRFFWSGLPYVLTYTQGLPRLWSGTASRFSMYLAHAWSLAIEEQFYLLWPALVLVAGRRRLPLLALACAGGSVLARSRGIWFDGLFAQADGLALGGWLAAHRLAELRPARPPRGFRFASPVTAVPALGGLLILITIAARVGLGPNDGLRTYPGLAVLAFNLLWLGLIDLVLTHAGRPAIKLLRLRPLRHLGRISYGLYLYHYPILLIALDLARGLGYSGNLLGLRLLAVLVSVPVAGVSWRFIERPLLERSGYSKITPFRVDRSPRADHSSSRASTSARS
ncbi:MAG: acyltransferase family protein [Isosphaerales bacterium]